MLEGIVYWHWLVLGMLLLIAELLTFSFVLLWFGLGAFVVAVALLIFPEFSLTWQLFVWAVASGVLTVLWFKYVKPLIRDKTKAGVAREAIIDETGIVIKVPVDGERGVMRFSVPILGADEWSFICEEDVELGARVRVKDVSGNTLIVVSAEE